jgi:mono/diheme cytochrome c family protein
LTEIPEHLLARSKARRAAMSGEGDTGAATTPATTESATPAAPAASATPAPAPTPAVEQAPEPTPPWVEAAQSRKKVPFWAVPVLAIIPVFFIIYPLTLDEPTDTDTALALGSEGYATACASCHGGGGGGGVGPQLSGGAVIETFPRPVDQVTWVALGSDGYKAAGESTYGATEKPIQGGMPGQLELLEPSEVMDIILHERVELGQEDFDVATWEDGFADEVNALIPSRAAEYIAVLEEWKTTSPVG